MKHYPSIPRLNGNWKLKFPKELNYVIFDKIDGSNIRAEWTAKNGLHKFGSRKVLIDESHEFLGESIQLIKNKYSEGLDEIFRKQRYLSVICFFEFYGPNSFAGQHENEKHDVVLIDVNPYKKGILDPNEFVKTYGRLGIPYVIGRQHYNEELRRMVEDGNVEGMTFEGVVGKAIHKNQHVMFKLKSNAWIQKVKSKYGDNCEELL
jgi:hypothetical protein